MITLLRVGLCTPEQCPARYCTQSMSCGLNLVWCLCHRSSHNPGESTEVPVQPPRRGCRPSAEEAGEHMVFSTWLLTSLLHLSGGGAELCLYLLGWRWWGFLPCPQVGEAIGGSGSLEWLDLGGDVTASQMCLCPLLWKERWERVACSSVEPIGFAFNSLQHGPGKNWM